MKKNKKKVYTVDRSYLVIAIAFVIMLVIVTDGMIKESAFKKDCIEIAQNCGGSRSEIMTFLRMYKFRSTDIYSRVVQIEFEKFINGELPPLSRDYKYGRYILEAKRDFKKNNI